MKDSYEQWLNDQIIEYKEIKLKSIEQKNKERYQWASGMLCAYQYSLEEYRRFRMNLEFDKK